MTLPLGGDLMYLEIFLVVANGEMQLASGGGVSEAKDAVNIPQGTEYFWHQISVLRWRNPDLTLRVVPSPTGLP